MLVRSDERDSGLSPFDEGNRVTNEQAPFLREQVLVEVWVKVEARPLRQGSKVGLGLGLVPYDEHSSFTQQWIETSTNSGALLSGIQSKIFDMAITS